MEMPFVPPTPVDPSELLEMRSDEFPESEPVLMRPPSRLAELAGVAMRRAKAILAAAYPLYLFNLISLYWP
jgi:hypothetical protein